MKLLMVYCNKFGYKTTRKIYKNTPDISEERYFEDILLCFVHAENQDVYDVNKLEVKLLRIIKASAKKNNTNRVILHSFDHLSENKANPKLFKDMFGYVIKRFENEGYECYSTPLGYQVDLDMKAPGNIYGRIFKTL